MTLTPTKTFKTWRQRVKLIYAIDAGRWKPGPSIFKERLTQWRRTTTMMTKATTKTFTKVS
jgi:hypothetical protein